jgi:serine/threonine protein kinase
VTLAGCTETVVVDVSRWRLEPGPGGAPCDITLPDKLNAHVREGTPYVLRTTLDLPRELAARDVVLSVPSMHGLVELEVNGVIVPEAGDALPVLYRETGPHRWAIPAATTARGSLSLALLVDHRWRPSAWWFSPPRLTAGGLEPFAALCWAFNRLGAAFMFVALLEVGIIHIAVFLTDRRRWPYFWFALQGTAACAYAAMVTGALQGAVGTFDGPLSAAFVCIALSAALHFFHTYFRLGSPPRVLQAFSFVCIVGCVATTDPLPWQPVWAGLTVALLVVVVVYHLVGCVGLALRATPPTGVGIVASSWIIVGVGGGADALAWLGVVDPLEGARGACPALAIFGLLQSLLLSRDHIISLKSGDALNSALQAQVEALEKQRSQVAQLNDELQRQVVDRSRQLFAALTLVGRGGIVPTLREGDLVQDRYRVVRQVGVGGMGAVYEVIRLKDQQRFALKLATKVEGAGLARLAREAEFAASLRHDNIIGVVDVDVENAGYLFIVMEFVDGVNLADLIETAQPRQQALSVLADICAGLVALHGAGIVHRDLKPSNVMVERRGDTVRARLMDFGISRHAGDEADVGERPPPAVARATTSIVTTATRASAASTMELITQHIAALDDEEADEDSVDDAPTPFDADAAVVPERETTPLVAAKRGSGVRRPTPAISAASTATPSSAPLTEFGSIIGTPLYMAPELGRLGGAVTPAADVFAVGVLAHEVLAGGLPFTQPPALQAMNGEPITVPARLATRCADLPPEVTDLIDQCLLEDPAARPSSATLAEVLRRAAVQRP